MEFTVGEKDTAKYYGSGKSEILATPALVRYMEATAQKIVDTGIPHDWQSIGTFFSVEHNSATPAGLDVEIHAILVSIDDKDLTFEIRCIRQFRPDCHRNSQTHCDKNCHTRKTSQKEKQMILQMFSGHYN